MKVQSIEYSLIENNNAMRVFVKRDNVERSIADISVDRDINEEEDKDYLTNLAIEIANDLGYELEA